MKMQPIEKVFLDKIVADSGQDITIVRLVLRAMLTSILKEVYANYYNSDKKDNIDTEYYIPYLFKLIINSKNVFNKELGQITKVTVNAESAITLTKEINRIFDDVPLEMEEFFKHGISLKLLNSLDFEKDTIVEVNKDYE